MGCLNVRAVRCYTQVELLKFGEASGLTPW